jgi:S1-C subfamily serine protease
VSDGIVTSEQQMPEGQTKLLFHTAPLSNGNSGGPLVDYCGSVVGVNTFVRRSELRSINIALSTADVVTFLEDTPAAWVMVQDQPCRPTIIAPRLPDAAPNPDAAVPEPAPDQPADVPKTDLAPQDTTEPTAPTDAPKSQGDE